MKAVPSCQWAVTLAGCWVGVLKEMDGWVGTIRYKHEYYYSGINPVEFRGHRQGGMDGGLEGEEKEGLYGWLKKMVGWWERIKVGWRVERGVRKF